MAFPGYEGLQISVLSPFFVLGIGGLAPDFGIDLRVRRGWRGTSLVVQGAAISSAAANGSYAWTDAHVVHLR